MVADLSMFLTDKEVAEMCEPLVAPAAQLRYLRRLGLTVNAKPNGRPLVVRSHAEAVLSGRKELDRPARATPTAGPSREALIAIFDRNKKRRSEEK